MKEAIGIAVVGIAALVVVVSITTSQMPADKKASEPYLRIACAEGKPSGVPCKDEEEATETPEITSKDVTEKIASMCLDGRPGSVVCSK